MGKTTKKTNPNLMNLIERLKREAYENKAPIWRDIADRLNKPKQGWAEVNLSRIERFAENGEIIVIAGKLLGAGAITKKVTVAAFKSSEAAKQKIASAGGKSMSIEELLSSNPKGSGIRIMG